MEAAWDELRERLEDLGVRWAASWTPRALELRLASDHRLGESERAALGRLAQDVEQVRYAPPGAPVREAGALRADIDLVIRGVERSGTIQAPARRRARLVPISGVRTIAGLVRRVDVAADQVEQRMGELGSGVRRLVGRR